MAGPPSSALGQRYQYWGVEDVEDDDASPSKLLSSRTARSGCPGLCPRQAGWPASQMKGPGQVAQLQTHATSQSTPLGHRGGSLVLEQRPDWPVSLHQVTQTLQFIEEAADPVIEEFRTLLLPPNLGQGCWTFSIRRYAYGRCTSLRQAL